MGVACSQDEEIAWKLLQRKGLLRKRGSLARAARAVKGGWSLEESRPTVTEVVDHDRWCYIVWDGDPWKVLSRKAM